MVYQLKARDLAGKITITLPGSKSETNRLLVIQALSAGKLEILNPSKARDSQLMTDLILSEEKVLDVEDAGTVMRFLTAYFSLVPGEKILTGSARMQQRPIGPLVDAIRSIGGKIKYLCKEGYPPLQIKGGSIRGGEINLDGKLSSQYASALILIAPYIPGGLTLHFSNDQVSRSYIDMTIKILKILGIEMQVSAEKVQIHPGIYPEVKWPIEGDYSSASYWFEWLCFLPADVRIKLDSLTLGSLQPDKAVVEIFSRLGISTTYESDGITIAKIPNFLKPKNTIHFDCRETPDVAQTIAVACAGMGVDVRITGLSTLRLKETDRIFALEKELRRIGLNPWSGSDEIIIPKGSIKIPEDPIQTYGDHRMVMAFAPLVSMLGELSIFDPTQVRKSYPGFWDQAQNFCEIISI